MYLSTGKDHAGIIIARRHPAQEVAQRLLTILNEVTADEMPKSASLHLATVVSRTHVPTQCETFEQGLLSMRYCRQRS